jgi:hypothetical protein
MTHLYTAVLNTVVGSEERGRLASHLSFLAIEDMQHPECELRRMHILGNSVNKGTKRKGRGYAQTSEGPSLLGNTLDMRAQREGRGVIDPGPRFFLPQKSVPALF